MLKARHIRHPLRTVRSVQSLLHFHADTFKRAREGRRTYSGDPRFQLNFVEQGFRHRTDSSQCDKALLHRICDAYKAATSPPGAEIYKVSEWWNAFRKTSLQPVIRALEGHDVDVLQRMYANFFRDQCSDGLVGKTLLLRPSLSWPIKKSQREAYLSESLSRLDGWKTLTHGEYTIHDLSGPEFGNPFGLMIDGVLVRAGAEQHHYYASRIAKLLGAGAGVVSEIGGGYGGMAYYLLRDHPQITYANFDLPETLALAAYYLINSFPGKRVLLCGEGSAKNIAFRDYDIVLLPPSELSEMPAECADLIFSSHVLCDLTSSVLSCYLKHVAHGGKRWFLYEGMDASSMQLQDTILSECPGFQLKEKKRFTHCGQNGSKALQVELLYERTDSQN